MDTSRPTSNSRQDYYDRLTPFHMAPLWERIRGLLTPEPRVASKAHRWSLDEMRPFLMEAVDLISAKEAERRVLILENPGLPGSSAITETLYSGFQIIMPGEVAPAHRHVAAAARLLLQGEGAYTAVDGERAEMAFGDFVLTPNWTWHDHGHGGAEPVIWLDVLDIPLMRSIGASFTEGYPEPRYPEGRPAADNIYRFGAGLVPVGKRPDPLESPQFHYPYARAREALTRLRAAGEFDPSLGLKMEYVNPTTGGAAMPTISAFLSLLPAEFKGARYRTTEGQILCVLEGRVRVSVEEPEGERVFDLGPKDVLVIPCWRRHCFESTQDAVLFTASDRVVQEKLGMWREKREG